MSTHLAGTAPEPYYCRTCRMALNTRRTGPGAPMRYLHSAEMRGEQVDHAADPVPLTSLGAQALMLCDFCSTPGPTVVFVCADQETDVHAVTRRVVGHADYTERNLAARVRRTETEHVATQKWGQRWAACGRCAAFVETDDVSGLIAQCVENMPAKYRRGNRLRVVRGELHRTFSHVLHTRLPGRSRITADNPLGEWDDQHGADPGNL